MNSARLLAGNVGCTSRTRGERVVAATGAMSRMKLKLSFSYTVALVAFAEVAHRPRRIGLRPGDARHCWQRSGASGQTQKISAGKFHFEPPFTSFDHLVGAGEQHRFVSLTLSSMLLDCLAIAVSVV